MSSIQLHGEMGGPALPGQGPFSGARGPAPMGRSLGSIEGGISARAEQMEAFRTCAKCGADNFTQRPLRG
jgi:hypothetical protein